MSGLRKAKEYDWKDSNMAKFGSDEDRKVKKESAETEPAWQGAGAEVGLQIWRIVKFKVTHWEKEQYGEFYSGGVYFSHVIVFFKNFVEVFSSLLKRAYGIALCVSESVSGQECEICSRDFEASC